MTLESGLLAAAAVAALLALFWFFVADALDMGWVRYGGLARQMVQSGDWVVPREGARVYLEKPPLFVWLVALVTPASGRVPVWALHLPNALALAVALGFTALFARRLFGRWQPAVVAAALLATLWESMTLARSRRLDLLFAACLTAALYYVWRWWEAADAPLRRRLGWSLFAAAWLAAAVLTKGPLALALLAGIAVLFAAWCRQPPGWDPVPLLAGVALFALLICAWPAALVTRLGWEETRALVSATDFTTRSGPWWLYLTQLPLRLGPWLVFLPALLAWLVADKPWRTSRGLRFLLVWIAVVFVPLHFSETRHHRYLLPLFPAASLLLTALWYDETGRLRRLAGAPDRLRRLGLAALLCAVLAAGAVAPLAALCVPEVRQEGWGLMTASLGVGFAVAGLVALRRLRRSGDLAAALRAACALALLGGAVYDGVRAAWFTRHDRTAEVVAALEPFRRGAPTALVSTRHAATTQHDVYLLTGRWMPRLDDADAADAWLRATGSDAYLVTDAQAAARLEERVELDLAAARSVPTLRRPLQVAPARPR